MIISGYERLRVIARGIVIILRGLQGCSGAVLEPIYPGFEAILAALLMPLCDGDAPAYASCKICTQAHKDFIKLWYFITLGLTWIITKGRRK